MKTDIDDPQAAALVQALGAQLEQQGQGPVHVVETHLSRLLLGRDWVYKFKRPVQLPFADFRTVDARHRMCAEELRLNRRLAPTLYRELWVVRGTPQAPVWGQSGQEGAAMARDAPLDWALRMRRFDRGEELGRLVQDGRVQASELQALAQRMAAFHGAAAVADAGSGWGSAAQIEGAIAQVLATWARVAPPAQQAAVAALQAWWADQPARLAPVWDRRQARGWVREGHGDLHLGNVVRWQGALTAFDCLEFDPALRWIDTQADIAFLAMDLKLRGRADLAWAFLDSYLAATGDYGGLAVLPAYEVYRALVRAMAAALPGVRLDAALPDYASGAQALAQPGRPRLLITHGLSGSGKSTVAAALLQAAGAVRLRSDVERKRLFGLDALADSRALGLDLYTAEANTRTDQRLLEGARQALEAGYAVIVDGAFLQQAPRAAMAALAQELVVPFAVLHCHADAATLRARVAQRQAAGGDASEAGLAVLAAQPDRVQPLTAAEQAVVLDCPTDRPWSAQDLAGRWSALAG